MPTGDFERLLVTLNQTFLRSTADEIADALWLAAALGYSESNFARKASELKPRGASEDEPGKTSPIEESRKPDPISTQEIEGQHASHTGADVDVHKSANIDEFPQSSLLARGAGRSSGRGRQVRLPLPPVLPHSLELEKSLRPLKAYHNFTYLSAEVDELATAVLAAEGVWTVLFRRAFQPRLEVVVVIEQSPTMRLWQAVARGFRDLLWRAGTLRWLETFHLDSFSPEVQLTSPLNSVRRHSPLAACRPNADRIILLLTDCLSNAWLSGNTPKLLERWRRHHPAIIVQMLPESMWRRTSLRCAQIKSMAPKLDSRNRPIPVLSLHPGSLRSLKGILQGDPKVSVPCYLDPGNEFREVKSPQLSGIPATPDPTTVFERFQRTAAPATIRLARSLAVAPLFLPVMRLIQHQSGAGMEHLAELFSSGLLRRHSLIGTTSETHPDRIEYEFLPGVRDRLMRQSSTQRVVEVWQTLSGYLQDHLGRGPDFSAILDDPSGFDFFSAGFGEESLRPFARIAAHVLRNLGGEYSRVGAEIKVGIEDSHPEEGPEHVQDPKPPGHTGLSQPFFATPVNRPLTPPPPSLPSARPPHGLDALRTYGTGFAGRQAELAELDRAWSEGVRVFVLHAQGGAGKTRVVARWLLQVSDDGWRGAGRVFVHSFYSQGSDERRNASSEIFFVEALAYFGHTGPSLTDPVEKGRTLARLVGEQRGLLVLDGLEPLQHPPAFDQGRLKDPAVQSLLLALAVDWADEAAPRGLCLVTSRQPVVELESKVGHVVVQRPLERLDPEAGAELLRQLEVAGPERELRQASEELRGHAYTLMLLGTYLRDATPDHEIRRRAEIPLLQEDAEHSHHARHLFAAYVRHLGESSPEVAVLRLLGFFDRPAEEKLLAALRQSDEPELAPLTAPIRDLSDATWRRVLRRLSELSLIDVPAGPSPPLDAHPLLRETFAEQVRTDFSNAWQAGHRRLFEVLCTTTEHRPDTLPGLQPLYQAVAHGCLAGLYEQARAEVYRDRILRGTGSDGFYSTFKLGAIGADLGAVASFFITPWTTLAPSLAPADQAWLLNEAAFSLRALGRLTEAAEPMRVAMEMDIEIGEWKSVAASAGNLSELELTRGEVAAAVAAGEQSVAYADRSRDVFQQMSKRTTQADALHQAGRRAESRGLFEDAEAQQAARQPEYPRLYSLQGFLYCDLLLAEAERAAWQRWLSGEAGLGETLAAAVAGCKTVSERAVEALRIVLNGSRNLLDIALNHLTLARATVYKANFANPIPAPAHQHITAAINGLRAAGRADYLPHGLLTRAWLLCLSGDEAGGRADLEEAWEIADRGPMPLFQADVLLTRARLFRDRGDLAEARRLIERHGYHRRDEELADAEVVLDLTSRPPLPSPSLPPGEGAPPPSREEARMADDAVRADGDFDVFLSYNSQDEPVVREIKKRLAERGVKAWLDVDELQPGITWQEGLEEAIQVSRSVAVFLGASGIGPWIQEEMRAALQQAVQDKRPVIPVLLPEASDSVRRPMFLGNRTWVDLRPDVPDGALNRLVWGITGKKLNPPSSSPAVLPPSVGREGVTTRTKATSKAGSSEGEDSMADQIFISYSHRDKKFMEELQTHLKPYLRSGAITPWSDKQIASGSQWFDEIQGGLSNAGAAVLLVSPDFLASDFIHEHELGPLLKEAKAGGVKILWVPLRPSAYEKTPLRDYQAVSSPDKPLAQMSKSERDSAWVEICKKIERAVASSRNSAAVPGTASTSTVTPSASPGIGGSAVKLWQEKLAFLLEEEAIASDPDQKFRLRKLIEEARQKIRELGR